MNVIGKEVTKITSIWDAVGVIADALGQSWLNYTDQLPRPIDENDCGQVLAVISEAHALWLDCTKPANGKLNWERIDGFNLSAGMVTSSMFCISRESPGFCFTVEIVESVVQIKHTTFDVTGSSIEVTTSWNCVSGQNVEMTYGWMGFPTTFEHLPVALLVQAAEEGGTSWYRGTVDPLALLVSAAVNQDERATLPISFEWEQPSFDQQVKQAIIRQVKAGMPASDERITAFIDLATEAAANEGLIGFFEDRRARERKEYLAFVAVLSTE